MISHGACCHLNIVYEFEGVGRVFFESRINWSEGIEEEEEEEEVIEDVQKGCRCHHEEKCDI